MIEIAFSCRRCRSAWALFTGRERLRATTERCPWCASRSTQGHQTRRYPQ